LPNTYATYDGKLSDENQQLGLFVTTNAKAADKKSAAKPRIFFIANDH
jgi:hypothetical protein